MNSNNNALTNDDVGTPILDSKHIVETFKKSYDVKLVDCGSYSQVYIYENKKFHTRKKDKDVDLELKKLKIDKFVESKTKSNTCNLTNKIEERSIIRSKLECQRLAKSNMEDWKTFITLTFEENVTSVPFANKRFRYFVKKVQRVKQDFKYLCIPEFQKRGAVHYHLLTNVSIDDKTLIFAQEDNPKFKHIKYWIDGFTSVEIMENDAKKVVGYIAKYMTKDIDDRLFGRHRYFYSQNLYKPKENFIDLESEQDCNFYKKIIQDKELIYQNEYINPYDGSSVTFLELSCPNKDIIT